MKKLTAIALTASAFAIHAETLPQPQGPKIVNVMPAFWEFEAAASKPMSDSTRDQLFRELVLDPHSDVYSLDEFRKNVTDDGIERYLDKVKPYLSGMRNLSDEIGNEIGPAESRFTEAFPDFDARVTVAFLPSLMHFDGQTTQLADGQLAVLFGLDGIVRFHGGDADMAVLFSHELFHAYHNQVAPGVFKQQELYAELWQEGLASYVSSKLNPTAPENVVMLDPKLAEADPGRVQEIARRFIAKFDSTSEDDSKEFFQYGYKSDLPSRSGYLLGYRVCQMLGEKHSLRELAHMDGEPLKTLIHDAVLTLAGAPSP
jgi:hypothetical protein